MPGFRGEQVTLPLHRWQQHFWSSASGSMRSGAGCVTVWHDFSFCFLIFSSFPGPSSHSFSTFHQPVRKVLPTKSQWWWHVQQSVAAASWASSHVCKILLYRGLHPACHLVSFGLLVFWKLLAPSLLRGPMSRHSTSSCVKPSGLVEQTLPLDPFEKVKPLEAQESEKRGHNLQKQSNG